MEELLASAGVPANRRSPLAAYISRARRERPSQGVAVRARIVHLPGLLEPLEDAAVGCR